MNHIKPYLTLIPFRPMLRINKSGCIIILPDLSFLIRAKTFKTSFIDLFTPVIPVIIIC